MAEIRKSKSPAKYNSYVRKKLGLDPAEESNGKENKPDSKDAGREEGKSDEDKEEQKPAETSE